MNEGDNLNRENLDNWNHFLKNDDQLNKETNKMNPLRNPQNKIKNMMNFMEESEYMENDHRRVQQQNISSFNKESQQMIISTKPKHTFKKPQTDVFVHTDEEASDDSVEIAEPRYSNQNNIVNISNKKKELNEVTESISILDQNVKKKLEEFQF